MAAVLRPSPHAPDGTPKTPPASLGFCDTCRFYDPEPEAPGKGWCRVHDPVMFPPGQPFPRTGLAQGDTRLGRWAMVLDEDWCGDWASRAPTPPPTEGTIRARAAARVGQTGNLVSQLGGVSVTKGAPGVYDLTFPAMGTPPLVPTAVTLGAETGVAGMHTYTNLTATGVRVLQFNATGNAADRPFSVVIV
jgi:hypothetical protein